MTREGPLRYPAWRRWHPAVAPAGLFEKQGAVRNQQFEDAQEKQDVPCGNLT